LSDREYFRLAYLQSAIEQGYVAMEFPQNPNHPKQRYYLTPKGIELKTKK
jgi:ATP-dependent DNA helicase RecG